MFVRKGAARGSTLSRTFSTEQLFWRWDEPGDKRKGIYSRSRTKLFEETVAQHRWTEVNRKRWPTTLLLEGGDDFHVLLKGVCAGDTLPNCSSILQIVAMSAALLQSAVCTLLRFQSASADIVYLYACGCHVTYCTGVHGNDGTWW